MKNSLDGERSLNAFLAAFLAASAIADALASALNVFLSIPLANPSTAYSPIVWNSSNDIFLVESVTTFWNAFLASSDLLFAPDIILSIAPEPAFCNLELAFLKAFNKLLTPASPIPFNAFVNPMVVFTDNPPADFNEFTS